MTRRALLLFLACLMVLAACSDGAPNTADNQPANEAENENGNNTENTANNEDSAKPTKTPGSIPDLTGETITLYHLGDLTGPVAFMHSPAILAVDDMVAEINDNGGIFGAMIEIALFDTQGNPDVALSVYQEVKAQNPALILISNDADLEALYTHIHQDRLPTLVAEHSQRAAYYIENGYVFSLSPNLPDQLAFFAEYLADNWDDLKPATAEDDIKLAYLSWDTPYGQAALTKPVQDYLEHQDIELVYTGEFSYSPGEDVTTHLAAIQKAEANVIYTNTYAFGPGVILNDMHRLYIREQFVVAGPQAAMDISVYAYLEKVEYFDSFLAPYGLYWWSDEDINAIEFAQANHAAAQRLEAEKDLSRLAMQGAVDVARYAIAQAILDAGYENLSPAAVYNVLNALEDYNVLGGLLTLDYTQGRRAPQYLQIRQVNGMFTFELIEDFSIADQLLTNN